MRKRPEWHEADSEHKVFASEVVEGHDSSIDESFPSIELQKNRRLRRSMSVDEIVQGVLMGDFSILAQAITCAESHSEKHRERAREILRRCLPYSGNSLRVGITGVPGAGKSTFIERLGVMLCQSGFRVAVLAVDPSSSVNGGSVLGDKTRMEDLTRESNAFIRPSPAGGTLGGVAAKTREAMHLCEAAGYNVVLIETVGVGQSEVAVRSMVDFFLLLQISGAGDELQGIKKGVIEMADAIIVNKADGDNVMQAKRARLDYARVLHYLQPYTESWKPKALTCSAQTGEGVSEIWKLIQKFEAKIRSNGLHESRRREQKTKWFKTLLEEAVLSHFYSTPRIAADYSRIGIEVADGALPVMEAVELLLAKMKSTG
ncbi:methylmalonyl Co-A mutase-associated GTPase MeaB [Puniceicoccaceae bacterium K14]|nr:methylmalonyl Co-A mutase-associated GTPase MeaB [Puniceicoccaceae bacterium K14]